MLNMIIMLLNKAEKKWVVIIIKYIGGVIVEEKSQENPESLKSLKGLKKPENQENKN